MDNEEAVEEQQVQEQPLEHRVNQHETKISDLDTRVSTLEVTEPVPPPKPQTTDTSLWEYL